jgi:hypothetical protein
MVRMIAIGAAAVMLAACVSPAPARSSAAAGLVFARDAAVFEASVRARYPSSRALEALLADLKSQGIDCASFGAGDFDCQKTFQANDMPCFDVWLVGIDAKDPNAARVNDIGFARRCMGALP